MNILILHQNFPGQFLNLARTLSAHLGWCVVGLGQRGRQQDAIPTARYETYTYAAPPERVVPSLQIFEDQVRRAQAVKEKLRELRSGGFVPDIVLAHSGWGEPMFVREVYPEAAFIAYLEFYYAALGRDTMFDPEFRGEAPDLDTLKLRNLSSLLAFAEADLCLTPTRWQASLLPPPIRDQVRIVHEGVDTNAVLPDPSASIQLSGKVFSRSTPLLTYVARSLEPYRGFHRFMRAVPEILDRHPDVHVLIVGGDVPSYGRSPYDMPNWRMKLLHELDGRLDLNRITFAGSLPYADYLKVLQISSVHVYLTYPFVMSWSLIESMACGCAIVGSRTPPVQEVINHGIQGELVDFFDEKELAESVLRLLSSPDRRAANGAAARQLVRSHFDFSNVILPRYMSLFKDAIEIHASRKSEIPLN